VPSSLPPDLLPLYLSLNHNLRKLAKHTGIDQLTLLDWLTSEPVREKLAKLREAVNESLTIRTLEARQDAIDALTEVLNETDDPIEKRRAATALLRALSLRPQRASSDPGAQSPMPSASPRKTPLPSAPRDVVATVIYALRENADLATLHAACHPDATIDGDPIPAHADDFDDDLDEDTLDLVTNLDQTFRHNEAYADNAYAQTWHLVREGGRTKFATFHLSPTDDHAAPWRIHAIDLFNQLRNLGEPHLTPTPRARPP
jgi:hypothetical protein